MSPRPQHTKTKFKDFKEIHDILYKENKMNEVITKDKQSSIEVSRNAKGQCAFKVKTYYDDQGVDALDIVDHNKTVMDKLVREFE
jgi:hypothetical protein